MIKRLLLSFAVIVALSLPAHAEDGNHNIIINHNGHYIYGSVGYGTILNNVNDSGSKNNHRNGISWLAGYEWISKSSIGVGLLYSGYTVPGFKNSHDDRNVISDMNYIAPQICGRLQLSNDKFDVILRAGVGISFASRDLKTGHAFGGNIGAGGEYKLSRHLGINASVSCIYSTIDSTIKPNPDMIDGVFRLDVLLGVAYQF